MREGELTRGILNYLSLKFPDAWIRKNLGGLGQRKGIPDIEFVWQGRAYFIEVKVGKNKLSPYQQKEIDQLRRAGAVVFVAYGLGDVEEMLGHLGKPTKFNEELR